MKKINEIIEDIQEAQINAGGRFLRQDEIKKMTIEELLELLLPNNVEFNIKYKDFNKEIKSTKRWIGVICLNLDDFNEWRAKQNFKENSNNNTMKKFSVIDTTYRAIYNQMHLCSLTLDDIIITDNAKANINFELILKMAKSNLKL